MLALRERIYGRDHPENLYALNNLGFILLEKGEWQQALPFLERGVDLMRKAGIGSKLANALANRARALEQKGDFLSATRDLKGAGKVMGSPDDQKTWIFAKVTAGAGSLEFDQSHHKAAAETARRALKMERNLGGEESPPYAASLMVLGDAMLFGKVAADAEAAYREALQIRRKKFNAGNPVIVASEVRLGEALLQEGKSSEAELLLRDAAASESS